MTITAIVLAAGQSKRMGQPKLTLPWGNTTVIGKAIETITLAGIDDVLVVTGGAKEEVKNVIAGFGVRSIHNKNFAKAEMLSSIQLGLSGQTAESEAVLICLGDQPQVTKECVQIVCKAYYEGDRSGIVVPSYQMRRGHPWLIARKYWVEILQMQSTETMRDFMHRHAGEIHYVQWDSPAILQDLDTPEDYLKYRP
ncbi:MAG: nucleotidyltransferase family protein [Chloroflexi bacterium]|nr:nucleotidyltransferase family protein [Chloroflexota bacterium]